MNEHNGAESPNGGAAALLATVMVAALVGISLVSDPTAKPHRDLPTPILQPDPPRPAAIRIKDPKSGVAAKVQAKPAVAQGAQGGANGLATPAFDKKQGPVPATSVEVVVKFKTSPAIKDITDLFWHDAAAAKRKFEALKSTMPELRGSKLDRVTYSNEVVIVHESGAASEETNRAMRDIAKKLSARPDVDYAEGDLTAHPGSK